MPHRSSSLPFSKVLLWVLALAALAVGLKNFERGITIDGALYATIARNIARTGELFRLQANVPDFHPYFADHPHLGFWLVAAVFKVLGCHDWSARIIGHLFYVAFLTTFFLYLRSKSGQKVAVLAVLLLWTWSQFSNIFSNVYLDPGTLFFGAGAIMLWDHALKSRRWGFAFVSGLSLCLCVMYKGVMVAGFLPSIAFLAIESALLGKKSWRDLGFEAALWLFAFLGGLALYWLAVRESRAPDYFALYWSRQITHRFGPGWNVRQVFRWEYWRQLLKYTYYLAPLSLLSLWRIRKDAAIRIAWALLLPFLVLFSGANLNGGQYLLMVMPWLAWLIALPLSRAIPGDEKRLVRASAALALAGVVVVNYLPIRIHGKGPPPEKLLVNDLVRHASAKRLFIPRPTQWDPYTISGSFAWYGDISVEYLDGDARGLEPRPGDLLWYPRTDPSLRQALSARGWHLEQSFSNGELWSHLR